METVRDIRIPDLINSKKIKPNIQKTANMYGRECVLCVRERAVVATVGIS